MACKIRCNDEVIVLTGKDKGVRGKVKSILFGGKKSIVVGINLVKKHQKPIPVSNELGGILTKETKIDISNLAIFNIDTKKPDRVGFIFKHGRKIRIFKSNGKIIK